MKHKLLASLFVLSIAMAARADENTDQAKMLFAAGAAAYDKRDYGAAIKAFEAAQRLAPHPAIVFSLAQAHRRQYYAEGKTEQLHAAVETYREYIKQVPRGGRHEDAMQALQELGANADRGHEQDVASVSINSSGTRNAHIVLDDGAPVEPPLIGPLSTGPHKVVISADGYITETRDIRAVAGKMVAIDVPLREKPAHVTLDAPSGARVDVDGRPMGNAPLASPLELSPGVHVVAVTQNGHEAFLRELELGRGDERRLDAAMPSSKQRRISLYMLGAAGIAAVAGGAFLSVTLVEQGEANKLLDIQKTRALTPTEAASYNDIRNQRIDWGIVTAATFTGAAALGITGLLLYVFDTPSTTGAARRDVDHAKPKPTEKKEPVEMSMTPLVSPGFAGANLFLKF